MYDMRVRVRVDKEVAQYIFEDGLSELLAELHAPLVEGMDPPNYALLCRGRNGGRGRRVEREGKMVYEGRREVEYSEWNERQWPGIGESEILPFALIDQLRTVKIHSLARSELKQMKVKENRPE